MHPPAGARSLRSLAAACLVATAVQIRAEEEARPQFRQAISRDLPRYDPTAYEKAQAEKAARAVPKNTPAPLPEPMAAGSGTTGPAAEKTLELPKITVHATTEPPKRLPRIETVKPVEVEKTDPMESVAGRDARLVKKHLSRLEQALNRFPRLFGVPAVALAREAEAREQKAAQMNELAAGIEIQEALGRDPAEIKKLRAEYNKLYYSGPK